MGFRALWAPPSDVSTCTCKIHPGVTVPRAVRRDWGPGTVGEQGIIREPEEAHGWEKNILGQRQGMCQGAEAETWGGIRN